MLFLLFMVYEAIRWFQTPSAALTLAIVFDLAVTTLIWHYYRSERTTPAREGQMRPASNCAGGAEKASP